jgi:hypothetical protein
MTQNMTTFPAIDLFLVLVVTALVVAAWLIGVAGKRSISEKAISDSAGTQALPTT